MKVIGKASNDEYLCLVNHSELEKFVNLYYANMGKLKVGDEIDLGKGYDFMHDTKEALSSTQKLLKDNRKVIDAITTGIKVMGCRAKAK